MADNVAITAGSGTTIAADDIGGVLYQRVKPTIGADGTAVDVSAGAGAVGTGVQRMTLASDDPAVAILGAAADAASTTTTIKAALRGIATALGITALDLGTGTGGSRTLRMFKDTAQWVGGSGVNGTAVQRVTIATDDGVAVVLGAKADAKSTATDTTAVTAMSVWKQISASVQSLVTGVGSLGTGTAAAATRVTVATDVGLPAGTARLGIVATPFMAVAGSTVTRPANTTAYTANDAVSNNATAGSVTAISFTMSDTNDDPIALERCRIDSTDTGLASTVMRAYFYQSDPTASTGVVGGDNAAFSTKKGTCIGTMVGTFKTFSDGSVACLTPEDGSRIITKPTSGAKTVFALLQTISGFTPSANSTTLIPTLEAFQGRA